MGTHAAAVALYPNLAYKPDVDFEPVGLIAEQPELLAVRKDLPPGTLKDFVAYAKANESKLNMAHAGIGSVSHVAACCSTRRSASSRRWCRSRAQGRP